jgi:hypothetical protein
VNCNYANLKYNQIRNFKSIKCDLETDFTHFGSFDLILNFGFLEAINEIDIVLNCCVKMSKNILLETLVCDSTAPDKVLKVPVDTIASDHPINSGISTRPSPFYIEQFFDCSGYSLKRYFDNDLNTPHHVYDWEHKNNESLLDNEKRSLRRYWHFYRD